MIIMRYVSYKGWVLTLHPFIIITAVCAILGSLFSPWWWALELINVLTCVNAAIKCEDYIGENIPECEHMRKKHAYIKYNDSIYVRKRIMGIPVWLRIKWDEGMDKFIDYKIDWQNNFKTSRVVI